MSVVMTDQIWTITVKHPMKKYRSGTVERDETAGVLRIHDSYSIEEIPLDDVVSVEDENACDPEESEAVPFVDLFNPDRVMEILREADEKDDPQWMVPVMFKAPDQDTAFRIKDTIGMLVKQGARQYADMNERKVHAFGLMRFDMWTGIQEFVERSS